MQRHVLLGHLNRLAIGGRFNKNSLEMAFEVSLAQTNDGYLYHFAKCVGETPIQYRLIRIRFLALLLTQPSCSHRRADVTTGSADG